MAKKKDKQEKINPIVTMQDLKKRMTENILVEGMSNVHTKNIKFLGVEEPPNKDPKEYIFQKNGDSTDEYVKTISDNVANQLGCPSFGYPVSKILEVSYQSESSLRLQVKRRLS